MQKKIDIEKLLVQEFKEMLELQRIQKEKDEKEFGPDDKDRKKLRKGGTVIAKGQGRLSELIKPTKIY